MKPFHTVGETKADRANVLIGQSEMDDAGDATSLPWHSVSEIGLASGKRERSRADKIRRLSTNFRSRLFDSVNKNNFSETIIPNRGSVID